MEEIKRGRVPFQRTVETRPAEAKDVHAERAAAAALRARQRPALTSATIAFKGNVLTGLSLDARKDLPPFLFNPPPKEIMAERRAVLAKTYAKPQGLAVHESANEIFA